MYSLFLNSPASVHLSPLFYAHLSMVCVSVCVLYVSVCVLCVCVCVCVFNVCIYVCVLPHCCKLSPLLQGFSTTLAWGPEHRLLSGSSHLKEALGQEAGIRFKNMEELWDTGRSVVWSQHTWRDLQLPLACLLLGLDSLSLGLSSRSRLQACSRHRSWSIQANGTVDPHGFPCLVCSAQLSA